MTPKRSVVVVCGASGDLGKAYLTHYAANGETCYGLTRNEAADVKSVNYIKTDLLDKDETRRRVRDVETSGADELLIIHAVGKFKWEGNNQYTFTDQDVMASNLNTFRNAAGPLMEMNTSLPIKIVAFGSLSDTYSVPMWRSYSRAKLALRRERRDIARDSAGVVSVFFSIGSINTESERRMRPYADTAFWIKPEDVVAKSAEPIENAELPYTEIDIFEPWPDYYPGYFGDFKALREKWEREMGTGK